MMDPMDGMTDMANALQGQVKAQRDTIRELWEENERLKTELDAANARNEELWQQISDKADEVLSPPWRTNI
jgi:regulator of replication initiation timing